MLRECGVIIFLYRVGGAQCGWVFECVIEAIKQDRKLNLFLQIILG